MCKSTPVAYDLATRSATADEVAEGVRPVSRVSFSRSGSAARASRSRPNWGPYDMTSALDTRSAPVSRSQLASPRSRNRPGGSGSTHVRDDAAFPRAGSPAAKSLSSTKARESESSTPSQTRVVPTIAYTPARRRRDVMARTAVTAASEWHFGSPGRRKDSWPRGEVQGGRAAESAPSSPMTSTWAAAAAATMRLSRSARSRSVCASRGPAAKATLAVSSVRASQTSRTSRLMRADLVTTRGSAAILGLGAVSITASKALLAREAARRMDSRASSAKCRSVTGKIDPSRNSS
mmetsp:Transcript_4507/g.14613  ORF Transcript_4507/g.14613 Transcript_4507/m.14613 type:complete len:292 (+) Transcript_4507:626-1501(+)